MLKFRVIILVAGDAVLALAAFYTALLVRFGYHEACRHFLFDNLHVPVILIGTFLFVSYLVESYNPDKNIKKRELLVNIIIVAVGSFFCLSALYYLAPNIMVGRGLLFLTILFFALYQYVWHFVYFFSHKHPRFAQQVLVLGTGELA